MKMTLNRKLLILGLLPVTLLSYYMPVFFTFEIANTKLDVLVVIPNWSSVAYPPYPLIPDGIVNPVLTAREVNNTVASFVADPFIFSENGNWYLFFEVLVSQGHGVIGLAVSSNGFNWTYRGIVLNDPFHHSYPSVFKWHGSYYMTPSSYTTRSVRLYRAMSFPYNWSYVTTLVSGRAFVDPTIFRYNNLWWMFVGDTSNSNCYLYYSSNLTDPTAWIQHPKSPIVSGDASKARPGGRAIVCNNNVIRFAQKCDITYGEAVRAFKVDSLTTTDYAEHEVYESPVIEKSGSGWNTNGMHTVDPWWIGDRWLVAVDGKVGGVWSIGIYVTPTVSQTEERNFFTAIIVLGGLTSAIIAIIFLERRKVKSI